MAALIPSFEYDIFISYRHKDNKYDGWVSEFVANLRKEIEATFKEDISIYFDENPHDGLLETHDVDDSLKEKLKCLIFLPIISQTYCDPKSFAWQHEFLAFKESVNEDQFGLKIKLTNGNVASRVLPVRIHEIDNADQLILENELHGKLRAIDFIYHSAGVNRPLRPKDDELHDNDYKTVYRNQVNKTANAIKEIIAGLKNQGNQSIPKSPGPPIDHAEKKVVSVFRKNRTLIGVSAAVLLMVAAYFIFNVTKFFPSGAAGINQKSIAVIPFKNMSENKENQHVCDGMMESILNHLVKMKDLHVISRTSVEQYRETTKTLPVIADELGVAHILEGSVQRAGGKLKVTAQLIHAATDRHLWSEEYVRDEQDIFSLQSEIAKEIASVLKITLSRQEQEQIARVPTQNMEAWNVYLQAQASFTNYWYSERRQEDYQKTRLLCDKALQLDPKLAEAYTLKATAYSWANWNREILSENFMDSAAIWGHKALNLDSASVLAHVQLGVYYMNTGRSDLAKKHLAKAVRFGPNQAEVYQFQAAYFKAISEYENAFMALQKALELSPRSVWLPRLYLDFSWFYLDLCDFEKSLELLRKAENLEPGLKGHEGWIYDVTGQKAKSKNYYEALLKIDSVAGCKGCRCIMDILSLRKP